MAPLRRLASLALGLACCMIFTSSAIAQDDTTPAILLSDATDDTPAILLADATDAVDAASDTVGADGENEALVLGGWPEMPIGDKEIAFLVDAIGNQTNYAPNLSFGLCMKDVFRLQYQSVSGTNFRFQGHGCLVQKGSTAIGACAAECAVEQLQVTIYTQEWTNTIQVFNIARLQVDE